MRFMMLAEQELRKFRLLQCWSERHLNSFARTFRRNSFSFSQAGMAATND